MVFALLDTGCRMSECLSPGNTTSPVELLADEDEYPEGTPEDLSVAGFAEQEAVSEAETNNNNVRKGVFVTIYSMIIVLIVGGNVSVAVTIMAKKDLREKTSELYLFSLVTARTMIGLLVVPARITGMFSEAYLGTILCKLCHYCGRGSSVASIYSIVAIAAVKLYQVKTGQPYVKLPLKKSLTIMIGVWIFSFLYALRFYIVNDIVFLEDVSGKPFVSCTVDEGKYAVVDKYFTVVDMITLFIIPLLIILHCYIKVINTLTLNKMELSFSTERLVAVIDPASRKAIEMLVILVVLFTICTVAPMILQLYKLWGGEIFEGYSDLENSIFIFSYSNAWINVIVFVVFREDLRTAFMEFFRRRKAKNNVVGVSPDGKGNSAATEAEKSKDGPQRLVEKHSDAEKGSEASRKESALMIEFWQEE